MNRARLLLWLCFACMGLLLPARLAAAPRIGVMTMQPGAVFWERFGHDALVVDDPARGEPISYNFGMFDPGEPGFMQRFIAGEMRYMLAELPLREDLENYRREGRGVRIQWLDLSPAEATALATALSENAKPENAHYRYDYFRDNCTTRVRDAIDRTLGGLLQRELSAGSYGETYRSEAARLASPAPWMWLGFELGMGPRTDVALSHWDDAFLPGRLAASLERVRRADGRPLVSHTELLLPHRLAPEPERTPARTWPWLLGGSVLGIGIVLLGRRRYRLLAALALPFWLLGGLFGVAALYAWLGTAHWAAAANHNLLLLSPLGLLLGWPALRWMRGKASPAGAWLARASGLLAFLALLVLWLGPMQRNASWVALLVPVQLALAFVFGRRTLHAV